MAFKKPHIIISCVVGIATIGVATCLQSLDSRPAIKSQSIVTRSQEPAIAMSDTMPMPSIWMMSKTSNLIVTGKVQRVIGVHHIPENSNHYFQQTTYEFVVENCFLDQHEFKRKKFLKPVIRVVLQGGNQPWSVATNGRVLEGQGTHFKNYPTLEVGERYLLYLSAVDSMLLKNPTTPRPTTTVRNIEGFSGEWEDLFPTFPQGGVVHLKDGTSRKAGGVEKIIFSNGPQLVNRSETECLKLVADICRDVNLEKETEYNGTPHKVPDGDPRRHMYKKWTKSNYPSHLNKPVQLDHD